jgi:hypothetical protein
MKVFGLVVSCVVAACSRNATPSADPAPSSTSATAASADGDGAPIPAWVASARRAPAELSKPALDSREAPKWPKLRAKVDGILDDAAAQAATADGIRKAASILADGKASTRDPTWAGSGTAPWAVWLHHAGLAILADLVTRACNAKRNDETVVSAIDAIELPPLFNSGGVDRGRAAADRNALRRAGARCGAKAGEDDPLR